MTTSKGSESPRQTAFPYLQHRQLQRSLGDLLTGTPVPVAAPSNGGSGDKHCGAGEYIEVRGENMCAHGKLCCLERVYNSLPEPLHVGFRGSLCKPGEGSCSRNFLQGTSGRSDAGRGTLML